MNTGIDDAVNLAWKLAGEIAGWGGGFLVDSYEAERRPIARRNTAFASRFADSIGHMPVDAAIEEDGAAGREARAALGRLVEAHAHFEFTIPGIFLGLSYAGSPIVAGDGSSPPPDDPNAYTPNACPAPARPMRGWRAARSMTCWGRNSPCCGSATRPIPPRWSPPPACRGCRSPSRRSRIRRRAPSTAPTWS